MSKKRRRFTADFKKRVALEALRERDTVQACLASIIFAGRRQLSLPVFLFLFFIHLLSSAIAPTF